MFNIRILNRDNPVEILTAGATAAAAAQTATLGAATGMRTYIDQIKVTGLGATAGVAVDMLITGLVGGTKTVQVGVPAGATVPVNFELTFPFPVPASADATAITVELPSFGTGNTDAGLFVLGHRQ